jgi:hypothetical protein
MAFLKIPRIGRPLVLVSDPDWSQIAAMLARDPHGTIRFALVNSRLVCGPASDVTHADICAAFNALLDHKPDTNLRIDAVGSRFETGDTIAFDLQTVGSRTTASFCRPP